MVFHHNIYCVILRTVSFVKYSKYCSQFDKDRKKVEQSLSRSALQDIEVKNISKNILHVSFE